VDEHNDAGKEMLKAIRQGVIPGPFKLLHFDSHPDMACMDSSRAMVQKAINGKLTVDEFKKGTDIASWIVPLVHMKYCTEVVWMSAKWCDQMPVGSFDLVVGSCIRTGKMKIASAGDKSPDMKLLLEYWESSSQRTTVNKLKSTVPWTLHVVRTNTKDTLDEKDVEKLKQVFAEGSWVLDIDEDFYSCNNPYLDEFTAFFGKKVADSFVTLGSLVDDNEVTLLQTLFKKKGWRQPLGKFLKDAETKFIEVSLQEGEDKMKAAAARKVVEGFYHFCRRVDPKVETGETCLDSIYPLTEAEGLEAVVGLPHHISTAAEIRELIDTTEELLDELPRPVFATIATSRCDRYLPDAQANVINHAVQSGVSAWYKTNKFTRWDKPQLSVYSGHDFIYTLTGK